jgi:hypothetical protein
MGGVNFKTGVNGAGQHPAGGAQGDDNGLRGNPDKTNSHGSHGKEPPGQSRRNGRVAARVGELAAQTQQVVAKIKGGNGHHPKSDSTTHPDTHSRSGRSHAGHPNGGDQHVHNEQGNRTHVHDSHGHDSHVRDLHGRGHSESSLTSAAVKYLRGNGEGGSLPIDVRGALDTLKTALGRQPLEELLSERGHKVEKLIDHFLRQSERASERGGEHAKRTIHRVADELVSAVQLEKHFARLERTGGDAARRAEEAVFRLLFTLPEEGRNDHQLNYPRGHQHDRQVTELWRDLRSGAFIPAQESYSQFQLTGRARVVNEMIELLHTLDALERGASQQFPGGAKGAGQQATLAETLAGRLANLTEAELAELLNLLPTLPGRAGRNEMVRLLAALSGPLMDADGKMLLAKDGTPLKPDQLLWLNTLGGLPGSSFKGELFPTHLSPLIVFGFDAL